MLMNNTQDQCINAEGQFNEAEGHFFSSCKCKKVFIKCVTADLQMLKTLSELDCCHP